MVTMVPEAPPLLLLPLLLPLSPPQAARTKVSMSRQPKISKNMGRRICCVNDLTIRNISSCHGEGMTTPHNLLACAKLVCPNFTAEYRHAFAILFLQNIT